MARIKEVCFVIALAAATAGTLSAASPKSITNPSKTNYAAVEGSQLLNQIQDHSQEVRDAIGTLNSRVRYAQADFETQGDALEQAKENINAMGADLQRLEELRAQLAPWQKRELVRIQPLAVELSSATTEAIQTLNHNQDRTWATNMPDELTTIMNKAGAIRNSVSKSIEVAKLNKEIDRLGQKS